MVRRKARVTRDGTRRIVGIPLRLQIGALIVVLFGAVALALGLTADRAARTLVEDSIASDFAGSADLSLQELRRLEEHARAAAGALAHDPIMTARTRAERVARIPLLATVLRAAPELSAAYVGWEDGDFVLLRPLGRQSERLAAPAQARWLVQWAGRDGARFEFLDHSLAVIERRTSATFDFDPRTRPWFRDAWDSDTTVITAPYIFFTTREPGITAARRAAHGGVAGVDLSLWALSSGLPFGRPTPSTEAALFDARGGVVGYSDVARLAAAAATVAEHQGAEQGDAEDRAPEPMTGIATPEPPLPDISLIDSPVLSALAARWRVSPVAFSGTIDAEGGAWRAMIMPLAASGMAFAMAAPVHELAAGPDAVRARILQILGFAILLGVPIAWAAGNLIARPVERFVQEVEAMAELDFSAPPPSVTRVAELAKLDRAIVGMRTSLASFAGLSRACMEEEKPEHILSAALDALMTVAGADHGAAWLVDEPGRLRCVALRGDVQDSRSGSVTLRSVLTEPTLAARIAGSPEPHMLSITLDAAGSRLLGVGLRAPDDTCVGALAVGRKAGTADMLSASVAAFAQSIALPAAIAIDRRRLLGAEKTALERFRLLARATSDLVWDWNIDADTVWWNDRLAADYGHDPSALPPGSAALTTLIHPEDRARVAARLEAARARGDGSSWLDEYRLRRADGSYATVVGQGFVIHEETSRATQMVGNATDVTALRDLDDRLRQAQKLEAIGQLTGGVAHDFNNLLTVILGSAELLEEQLPPTGDAHDLATAIRRSAERGAALTHRLLAFARRQRLDARPIDANALIAGMGDLLRRSLGEHVEVEIHLAPALRLAMVDPSQLENAVLNLCLNARDAMASGGRLVIETANADPEDVIAAPQDDRVSEGYIVVTVSDTGIGMNAETVARAFEPFFTTKDVGKGSGLGLSMVYGFVKQSGGHVHIRSEPGSGTAVLLYLPQAPAAAEKDRPQRHVVPIHGSAERILLVEDDELVRAHAMRQLRDLGYVVTAVENGRLALALVERGEPFDLLLTDVVMPGGLDGRALAEQVRALRPQLPVLFASGYAEAAFAAADGSGLPGPLLPKPYRRQDLAAKVRELLARSSSSHRTAAD